MTMPDGRNDASRGRDVWRIWKPMDPAPRYRRDRRTPNDHAGMDGRRGHKLDTDGRDRRAGDLRGLRLSAEREADALEDWAGHDGNAAQQCPDRQHGRVHD